MQEKYNIMLFRQDLSGFGEPAAGKWDGFQRINTESQSGGIVGVFKQNANENNRVITVNYLENEKRYNVIEAISGKIICTQTGDKLRTDGFKVIINEDYGATLYEISEVI